MNTWALVVPSFITLLHMRCPSPISLAKESSSMGRALAPHRSKAEKRSIRNDPLSSTYNIYLFFLFRTCGIRQSFPIFFINLHCFSFSCNFFVPRLAAAASRAKRDLRRTWLHSFFCSTYGCRKSKEKKGRYPETWSWPCGARQLKSISVQFFHLMTLDLFGQHDSPSNLIESRYPRPRMHASPQAFWMFVTRGWWAFQKKPVAANKKTPLRPKK